MWGARPTEFLNEWSDQDRELAIAMVLLDRGRCPGCGHAKSKVWVEGDDCEFDVIAEEVQCQACRALEDERGGTKTQKGLHYYADLRPRSESPTG